MLQYLVTGTGRSGTVYMARLLTSLGIMCGHESVFDRNNYEEILEKLSNKNFSTSPTSMMLKAGEDNQHWFVPEKMIAESSYMAAPFLDIKELSETKIIHIVRNPISVLSSWVCDLHFFHKHQAGLRRYYDFIALHCPDLEKYETEIERACYYYIAWNRMAEKKAHIRLQVEEQPSKELLNFLKIKKPPLDLFNNTKVNSWKKRKKDLGLSKIPNGPLKESFITIMKDYGYPIPRVKWHL